MQKQFSEVKAQHPNSVVLFRLGDFYETFHDDAKEAARILGIALTGRGKDENRIPMAGIPHHALPNYLPKFVAAGKKVVIVDQISEPQPGKLVEREVTEIISPGAIFDEKLLAENKNNYLAAVNLQGQRKNLQAAVAIVDVSTSEVKWHQSSVIAAEVCLEELKDILNRYEIRELVLNEKGFTSYKELWNKQNFPRIEMVEQLPEGDFSVAEGLKELKTCFGLNSLKPWGIENSDLVVGSLNGLRKYLEEKLKKKLEISQLQKLDLNSQLQMPLASYRALEVFSDATGNAHNSLFNYLNRTATPGGKRELANWCLQPSNDTELINFRHESIATLQSLISTPVQQTITNFLDQQIDYERFLTKYNYGRVKPHDIKALAKSILALESSRLELATQLPNVEKNNVAQELTKQDLSALLEVVSDYDSSLNDGVFDLSAPGFINPDCDPELEKIVGEAGHAKEFLQEFERKEIKRSGISSLKVRYNKVFGYYIEISKSNLAKVPTDYIRKQTLVNAERFLTEELKTWEERILNNHALRLAREKELFAKLVAKLAPCLELVERLGRLVKQFDVLWGFAILAQRERLVRPQFNSDLGDVHIQGLKHPVIAQKLGAEFVANNLELDQSQRFLIITGPNMAGKSTYIRSVAILQFMAQIGCFVPAESALLNVVDGIFTRVGAADNLSQNESTFMVEMNEMAYILNHATERSLIVLDEVGRGTSTYDGVSLAWALVEEMSQKLKAYTLFATHYHELIELEKTLPGVKNFSVEVIAKGGLYFTHKVKPGGLNRSFGVAVAKMAGINSGIVGRASEILKVLESENDVKSVAKTDLNYQQLGLLAGKPEVEPGIEVFAEGEDNQNSELIEELKSLKIDDLTPMNALIKLKELQESLD